MSFPVGRLLRRHPRSNLISTARQLRRFVTTLSRVPLIGILSAGGGCATARVSPGATVAPVRYERDIDVTLVTDETDAALGVVRAHAASRPPTAQEWAAVLSSRSYSHLKEREASMGRAFTDSSFETFLTSDSLAARLPELQRVVPALEHTNVESAARKALAYLPRGTHIRTRLYLEIKPVTNSFVFTGRDSIPSIFLYVQPRETTAQLDNTLAHELHHIGTNTACPDRPQIGSLRSPASVRMLLDYLTAFGEGRAMLAAAGSPDINPHATDADSIQSRWNRDVANAPHDIRELSGFISDVLSDRIATADSVRKRGNSYFGVQGPWYTVGWLMASTVERELGREALTSSLCDGVAFLAQYNSAAQRSNSAGHPTMPTWPTALLDSLAAVAPSREKAGMP